MISSTLYTDIDPDDREDIEMSRGQKPDSHFTVPRVKGRIHQLVSVPNTSKYISNIQGPGENFGLQMFDLARPEAGSTVAGLGLGDLVACINTHEVKGTSIPARLQ